MGKDLLFSCNTFILANHICNYLSFYCTEKSFVSREIVIDCKDLRTLKLLPWRTVGPGRQQIRVIWFGKKKDGKNKNLVNEVCIVKLVIPDV